MFVQALRILLITKIMNYQDFERYATQVPMDGLIADVYKSFFNNWIEHPNSHLRVLDLGCGDGKYLDFFKQFFKEENIFGAEISRIRVDRCKNKGWKSVYLIERLKKLPFPDEYFDFINFDQVIEHISLKEIDFYLTELARILRRNGKIIIVTPNYPIKRIYDLLTFFLTFNFKKVFDDPTHVTHYNFRRLDMKVC